MKKFRYIALLAALVGLSSCVQSDVDTPTVNNRNAIQVVGRVKTFSERTVGTRADEDKVGKEGNTECMCLAVFGSNGVCKLKEFEPNSAPTFTLDKTKLANGDQIYIFANIPNPDLAENDTLDEFLSIVTPVSGVTEIPLLDFIFPGNTNHPEKHIQANCFPMIGSLTITDPNTIPEIIQIGLESVYAKIMVNIISKPDQKVDGIDPASFSLTGFEVHNVASGVDFKSGTESKPLTYKEQGVVDSSKPAVVGDNDSTPTFGEDVVFNGVHIESDLAQSSNEASFYFYLPERFLRPSTTADDYNYPWGEGLAGLDDDERRKFPQRYKPVLANGCAQPATFVRFFGEYVDHQGKNWDVSYDIYVGGDNYSNFDIVRNTLYKNIITIKGIQTSNDQTTSDTTISIDHRVNVERVNPVIINLRRETLLDSHFEVRPLRIRKNNDFKGQDLSGAEVEVEVVYSDKDEAKTTPNKRWIGLERSFGDGTVLSSSDTYLVANELASDRKNSAGKRKYFTTDLTTNTLSGEEGQKITIPVTDTDQTVWVYVDECAEVGDKVRSATITVKTKLGTEIIDSTGYIISQRLLLPVTYKDQDGSSRSYNIEYQEEYLYNFDAEDNFGQTEWNGMPWGLNEVQLSQEHNSFYIDEDNDDWNEYVATTSLLKYDFYIGKHDTSIDSNNIVVHNYAGQHFTEDIVKKSNNGVKTLNMAEPASGAVEYCYNRNKRNADGSIAKVEWYLPSADELEDIIIAGYGNFKEFQDKYYWTSQPAYIRNAFYYQYATGNKNSETSYDGITDAYAFVAYEDNTKYARATKVVAKGDNQFDYALSGLKKTPDQTHAMDNNCITQGAQLLDGSYFNVMYGWYRWNSGTSTKTFTADEHFNPKKDNSSAGSRIHVHNGHLYDMTQEGYHERTKYNRVRCVRKATNIVEEQKPTIEVGQSAVTSLSADKVYVIRNTNYPNTYLTTSGSTVAATSTFNNYCLVKVEKDGNNWKIKSYETGKYFNGTTTSTVSLADSGTTYTISATNGNQFTISFYSYYYLKQTNDRAVSMIRSNNGKNTWYFYEVEIQ